MVRIVTSWFAVEASRSKLGVCLAFVCLVVVAGIAEPNTSKAQITQGPSGPFMAEDSTGRVVGAADIGNFARVHLWITVGSVTAPIGFYINDDPPLRFSYTQIAPEFATPNCTGQAYVLVYRLYSATAMTTTAAIFSIGDAAETIYVSDPSSTPIALTMNSRLEGSICQTLSPTPGDVFEANPAGGALASEFTPPFYVVPNPAYNTAMSVPIGAPWALAVVLAGAYLNVLRRKRTSE